MEILQCGTKVKTLIGNYDAMITATCIRFEKLTYEVSYFWEGEYNAKINTTGI